MMLFRVPWNRMFDQGAYVYWNGSGWGTKEGDVPGLQGTFGKPSLRKLSDGTWALATPSTREGASTREGPKSSPVRRLVLRDRGVNPKSKVVAEQFRRLTFQ
jgi:hypothetical protein